MSLHRERERDKAHVDDEVGRAGEQPEAGGGQLVGGAVRKEGCDLEHARCCERRQGQGADVEEDVVQRRAACTPLDGHACEREWQCGSEAEERSRRETAHGADREHGRSFVGLERESLPHSDEPDHREQAQEVLGCPREREADDARPDTDRADETDDQAEAPVE